METPWRLHGALALGPNESVLVWGLQRRVRFAAGPSSLKSRLVQLANSRTDTVSHQQKPVSRSVLCKFHQKPPLNSCFPLLCCSSVRKGSEWFRLARTCLSRRPRLRDTEMVSEACWSLLKRCSRSSMSCPSWRKNKKNKFNPFRVVPRRSLTTSSPPGRRRRLDAILRPLSGGARGKQRLGKFPKTWQFQEVCKKYARSMQEGSEVRSLYKFITCCFWYLWCLPFKSSLTDFGACLFACWQFWGRKSNEDFVFLCVSAIFRWSAAAAGSEQVGFAQRGRHWPFPCPRGSARVSYTQETFAFQLSTCNIQHVESRKVTSETVKTKYNEGMLCFLL
jgi:hypothetical protein